MVGKRDILFFTAVFGGLSAMGVWLLRMPTPVRAEPSPRLARPAAPKDIVTVVDADFHKKWAEAGLTPAKRAPELLRLRRLALGLTGAAPSVEDLREFEYRPADGRVEAWLEDLFRDRRFADFVAERFARAFVGTEDGPFLLFRRRRFTTWLSDALIENRPYDAVVRDLIADSGLWTDHPATNFVSVTFDQATQLPDPERLGARVARAFLGVRLDCARCHDHPFQPWKQDDFRGIAAFFGGVHADLRGIRDGAGTYEPLDRKTKKPIKVEPHVPFRSELLPKHGAPRQRLAAWVVSPKNPNLARVTVNRMWAILFGRPLVDPVDDLPPPGDAHPALEHLAADFVAHGYDIRRLIRTIAATEAFNVDSADGSDADESQARQDDWASFPMTPLRPEQVAGAVFQSAVLRSLDADDPWFARLAAYTGRNDFVRRYGDFGEDEFLERTGTIPQRLLLMNGDIVRDRTKADILNASRQIADLAPDDPTAVDVTYLAALTRHPSDEERAHFLARLKGAGRGERHDRMTDLYWTLLNTTEFSWNH